MKKTVTQGSTVNTTEYLNEFQYLNGTLQFIQHAEGYVKYTAGGSSGFYNYVYHIKDHLGNIRVTFTKQLTYNTAKLLKENHYYPFGLKHPYNSTEFDYYYNTSTSSLSIGPMTNSNRYQYNSKEWQNELSLNLYDYGARMFDPAIGRWGVVDPLAEKFPNVTPYRYGLNNPIKYIDIDGNIEWPIKGSTAVNKKDVSNGGFSLKNTVVRTSLYLDTDRPIGSSNPHIGIDYRAKVGSPFYSLGDGTVVKLGHSRKGGKYITVEYDNGDKITFRHLKNIESNISIGDEVYEGQILGQTGKTGTKHPHLHIDACDSNGDIIDPENRNYGTVTNYDFFNYFEGDYKELSKYKRNKHLRDFEKFSNTNFPQDNTKLNVINILQNWLAANPNIKIYLK
jgi:RHS repeat-associated protein